MSQYTSGQGGSGSLGDQSKQRGTGDGNKKGNDRGGSQGGQNRGESGNGSKDPKKVVQQVKQGAGEAVSQVKEQATNMVQQQKDTAAEKLHSVSEAIRNSAQGLQDQNIPGAQYIDQAAQSIDQFSTFLRDGDFHDLVGTVEGWARKHPAVFLGGSLIAGLLLARFIKSSRENEFDRSSRGGTDFSGMEKSSRYGRGYQTGSSSGLRGGIESTERGQSGSSLYAGGSVSPSTTAPGMTVPGSSASPSIGTGGPSSSWEEST